MNTLSLVLTRIRSVRLEVALPLTIFTVPLFVSGPQVLTGTLVNCLLFLSASTISRKNLWLMVALPSVGALLHGVLFGPFTPFLAYLLPFIWVSNGIMVLTYLFTKKRSSSMVAVIMGASLKATFLFLATSLFVILKTVPSSMLIPMGVMQLVTAILGGALALILSPVILKSK